MDDADFLLIVAAVALLAIAGIMEARIVKQHDDMLLRHDEDITFLRLVTRGLEEKVAD